MPIKNIFYLEIYIFLYFVGLLDELFESYYDLSYGPCLGPTTSTTQEAEEKCPKILEII